MMEGQTKRETEKQRINAIIFDLDGLLIDSEPVWNDAYVKFISVKGLPDEPAVSSHFRGMGIKEIVGIWKKEYGLEGEIDQLAAEYRSCLYGLILEPGRLKLMDGATVLLEKLKGKYVLGVATSGHRDEMARKILGLLGVENYFDQIISGDDVTHGKPAPDVYLESARKIAQRPINCLALEDSVNGVLSGKASGMKVIGVNADEKLRQQLQEAGADEVYSTLGDVRL
ncbi:MAG: HAD family phosphatase [Patescibacteria group bacterium]